jgi:hypothetical protein
MALRLVGFVSVLGILGLSGYAALDQARKGTLSPVKGASDAALRAEFESANYVLKIVSGQLEQVKVLSGSYEGTLDLGNFPLVRLVRASEASYCLEFEKTHVFSLAGPGGVTVVGRCP